LAGLYVELNEAWEGSDVHLLHVTQTTLEHVTLAILAFGFSALVVVDAPRFLVVKEEYSSTLSIKQDFPGMVSLFSIHDGSSVL
jgi:hypothetical protein